MQRMEQPYQMMQNPCTTDQVRFLCGPCENPLSELVLLAITSFNLTQTTSLSEGGGEAEGSFI